MHKIVTTFSFLIICSLSAMNNEQTQFQPKIDKRFLQKANDDYNIAFVKVQSATYAYKTLSNKKNIQIEQICNLMQQSIIKKFINILCVILKQHPGQFVMQGISSPLYKTVCSQFSIKSEDFFSTFWNREAFFQDFYNVSKVEKQFLMHDLMYAIHREDNEKATELIQTLHAQKIDLNSTDEFCFTPLLCAVFHNNIQMARQLCQTQQQQLVLANGIDISDLIRSEEMRKELSHYTFVSPTTQPTQTTTEQLKDTKVIGAQKSFSRRQPSVAYAYKDLNIRLNSLSKAFQLYGCSKVLPVYISEIVRNDIRHLITRIVSWFNQNDLDFITMIKVLKRMHHTLGKNEYTGLTFLELVATNCAFKKKNIHINSFLKELYDNYQQYSDLSLETFNDYIRTNDIHGIVDNLSIFKDAINATDYAQFTPLMYAVLYDNCSFVDLLLSNGASFDFQNFQGISPFTLAQSEKTRNILLKYKAVQSVPIIKIPASLIIPILNQATTKQCSDIQKLALLIDRQKKIAAQQHKKQVVETKKRELEDQEKQKKAQEGQGEQQEKEKGNDQLELEKKAKEQQDRLEQEKIKVKEEKAVQRRIKQEKKKLEKQEKEKKEAQEQELALTQKSEQKRTVVDGLCSSKYCLSYLEKRYNAGQAAVVLARKVCQVHGINPSQLSSGYDRSSLNKFLLEEHRKSRAINWYLSHLKCKKCPSTFEDTKKKINELAKFQNNAIHQTNECKKYGSYL